MAWLLILFVVACTTSPPPNRPESAGPRSTPDPAATTPAQAEADCEDFKPDPSGDFYTPTDVSYQDVEPPDWELGTPAEVGLDEALLDAAADNAALSPVVQSLLVARHGKLVFERYFNGSDVGEANNVASVSKSILSLVTGIAIEDGLLALDSRIDAFLPSDLVGDHGDLTVQELLTMSGGLRLNEPEYDYPPGDSFVRAVLGRPTVAEAGTEFAYSTGLTQVLAAVVTEATGTTLCAYATTRLLGPLGIEVEEWWVEPGGYDAGGHSLFITPREMARLGQLVLQGGTWNGEQLVPESWLDLTLAERWDLGCRGIRPVHRGYGYLWWPLDVDGHLVWQASGYGNQQLWIVPDMDLLLVVTHDAASVGDPARQESTTTTWRGRSSRPRRWTIRRRARRGAWRAPRCARTGPVARPSPTGRPTACRGRGHPMAPGSPSGWTGAISTARSTAPSPMGQISSGSPVTSPSTTCPRGRPMARGSPSFGAVRPAATCISSTPTGQACPSSLTSTASRARRRGRPTAGASPSCGAIPTSTASARVPRCG